MSDHTMPTVKLFDITSVDINYVCDALLIITEDDNSDLVQKVRYVARKIRESRKLDKNIKLRDNS